MFVLFCVSQKQSDSGYGLKLPHMTDGTLCPRGSQVANKT